MNLKQKLEALTSRRNQVMSNIQRVQGHKEASERELQRIDEECRSKKVDPEKLEEAIEKLELALAKALEEAESKIKEAEEALTPYLEAMKQ